MKHRRDSGSGNEERIGCRGGGSRDGGIGEFGREGGFIKDNVANDEHLVGERV